MLVPLVKIIHLFLAENTVDPHWSSGKFFSNFLKYDWFDFCCLWPFVNLVTSLGHDMSLVYFLGL